MTIAQAPRPQCLLLLTVLLLAGCGQGGHPVAPLGRSLSSQPAKSALVTPAPPPQGDPLPERGGTIPPAAFAAQQSVSASAAASSPAAALRRYALAYVNWTAAQLPAREHELAGLAIGQAKQAVAQTAASRSSTTALIADDVANTGQVIAVARGEGPDRSDWVAVTLEHTTGDGPYAALPAGPHVTIARVTHLTRGWVVSAWNPLS